MAMEQKTIYFVGGLPRSGSTLLMNILGQNPHFHVTGSSGLLQLVNQVLVTFDDGPFLKAMPEKENMVRRRGVLEGMIQGYFSGTAKTICFDKNRHWTSRIETLKWVLGEENVKLICCVRDLRDVLASFEMLHRKTVTTGNTSHSKGNPIATSTAVGRAMLLMQDAEVVGSAKNAMVDALTRGQGRCIYCMDYEDLTNEPERTMRSIYGFLGHEYYDHNFEHVEAVTKEDDRIHGFKDLHTIRNKVEPQKPRWPEVYDDSVIKTPFWESMVKIATFWRGDTVPEGVEGAPLDGVQPAPTPTAPKGADGSALQMVNGAAGIIQKQIVQEPSLPAPATAVSAGPLD